MAVTITTGDLRHKAVFKQPTSSLNDEGGRETTSYTNAITTWAAVRKFNQYRTTQSNATVLTGALDFYIRHSADRDSIGKDWLINYNGSDYTIHEIERVDEDGSVNVDSGSFIRFTAKTNQ